MSTVKNALYVIVTFQRDLLCLSRIDEKKILMAWEDIADEWR